MIDSSSLYAKREYTAVYSTDRNISSLTKSDYKKMGYVAGNTEAEATVFLSEVLAWSGDGEAYATVVITDEFEEKARYYGTERLPDYSSAMLFYLRRDEKKLVTIGQAKVRQMEDV